MENQINKEQSISRSILLTLLTTSVVLASSYLGFNFKSYCIDNNVDVSERMLEPINRILSVNRTVKLSDSIDMATNCDTTDTLQINSIIKK